MSKGAPEVPPGDPAPQGAPQHQGAPVLRAIFVYGVAAFSAGFVLGVARELALAPLMGQRAARWLEFPFLMALTFVAAHYALARKAHWSPRETWLVGAGGVIVLLALESSFALLVVKQPLETWLASFDISAGALFPWGLAVMFILPFALQRSRTKAI